MTIALLWLGGCAEVPLPSAGAHPTAPACGPETTSVAVGTRAKARVDARPPQAFSHQRTIAVTAGLVTGPGASGEGALVAADEASLYTLDPRSGYLLRVPRAGGTPQVLATGQRGAQDLAVDEDNVYWVRPEDGAAPVSFVAKTGGPVGELGLERSGAQALAVDESHVYWAVGRRSPGAGAATSRGIRRRAKFDGKTEWLTEGGDVTRIVLSGDDVLFLDAGTLDVAAEKATESGARVRTVPKKGGAVTTLAAPRSTPADLGADATHVYWTERGLRTIGGCRCNAGLCAFAPTVWHGGGVWRAARHGGAPEALARDDGAYGHFVLGLSSLLVAEDGAIVELPKSGGPASARFAGQPSRYAVDGGEAIAWVDDGLVAFGP